MANSRFVNINSYCLVEYIYTDSVIQEDCNLYLVDNGLTNSQQIFNSNSDIDITNNIQDYSVIPYGNNRYAVLDEENDIISYNSKLKKSSIIQAITLYDTVRFHFISGIDLTAFTGLILSVKNLENNEKFNTFCSIFVNSLNYGDLIKYNTTPIFLSESKYDRYIEVRIPSIKKMNNSYYSVSPQDPNYLDILKTKLASKITLIDVTNIDGNFVGFINNAPITFSIDECSSEFYLKSEDTTYLMYNIENHKEASLPQINEYESFSCYISEATDGNYFKYYASYNGGFPGEFITSLTNGTDKWTIIHQLNVYEFTQHGGSEMTSSLTTYQDIGFDEEQLFRPVLKHSGIDVSFTIDYMVRLLNENNGEQIIRTGSIMSYNVNSYGKNTVGIKMLSTPNAHRVYNKVFKSNISQSDLFIEPEFNNSMKYTSTSSSSKNVVIERLVRFPLYIDYNKISISDKILSSESITDDRIIYKQGDLRIVIKPFDTYLKFKIYQESNGTLATSTLDPMNIYRIVFITDSNNGKIVYESDTTDSTIRPYDGDLIFNIPEIDILKILSSNSRDFYITSYNYSTLRESIVYSGFWYKQTEIDEYNKYISDIKVEYGITDSNNKTMDALIASDSEKTNNIPSDVYIPGYTEQSSNGSEISSVLKTKPKQT